MVWDFCFSLTIYLNLSYPCIFLCYSESVCIDYTVFCLIRILPVPPQPFVCLIYFGLCVFCLFVNLQFFPDHFFQISSVILEQTLYMLIGSLIFFLFFTWSVQPFCTSYRFWLPSLSGNIHIILRQVQQTNHCNLFSIHVWKIGLWPLLINNSLVCCINYYLKS